MTVAEQVEDWVVDRPYVQEALAAEIVNFSALARTVQEDVDGGFEAVKIALRRLAEDIKTERGEQAETVADVLQGSSIELRSNMTVCKHDTTCQTADIHARTEHGVTCIHPPTQDCAGTSIPDQVLISLHSPTSLENTPGVLAYLLSLLAGADINVTELISCREDTHLVIDQADATTAFDLLNDKLS